ncbi:hypothetical protein AB1Y20_008660 [Prymnesium parvum]|uniref:Uncharacterized protein n=1 Tax=Prymnesium parvum TaxID=97485 RepID=A0AB34ISC1_PRYPA
MAFSSSRVLTSSESEDKDTAPPNSNPIPIKNNPLMFDFPLRAHTSEDETRALHTSTPKVALGTTRDWCTKPGHRQVVSLLHRHREIDMFVSSVIVSSRLYSSYFNAPQIEDVVCTTPHK